MSEGYLFIPQLVPKETVLALRSDALQVLQDHGWLDPDFPLMHGATRYGLSYFASPHKHWEKFFSSLEEFNRWSRAYCELIRLRRFQELGQHPALMELFESLFEGPVLPHGANGYHHLFPGDIIQPAPAHQDHHFFHGSTNMWAAWISLGDLPPEFGGLEILPRSHNSGLIPLGSLAGKVIEEVPVPESDGWFRPTIEAGDVLIYHNLSIHRGLHNRSKNRLRLAASYRYQPRQDPVHRDCLLTPHSLDPQRLSWEEVYADWDPDHPLRYYWKKWILNFA